MIHFLYVLYSNKTNKYYVGETYNVPERISKHNEHFYEKSFSKIADDWELVLEFECSNKQNALFLENFIKKMKSKVFIEKIIANPKILSEILSKN